MLAVAVALLATGCTRSPEDDYNDFLERSKSFRPDGGPKDMGTTSQLEDLRGVWFLNALLNIGSNIALIIEFTGDDPQTLQAAIWYKVKAGEPLVKVPVTVADDGTFDIVAPDLVLPAEVLNAESPVIASVTLRSRTVDANGFCGVALGPVTSPLAFDLEGSTYFALRDDDATLTLADVPFVCPAATGGRDAGIDAGSESDGGLPDAGTPRPESPDLSDVISTRTNLTGHFIVAATFAGQPLNLWASLVDTGGGAGALDGAIRLATATSDSPALLTFSTTIDEDGRFEIWLPGLDIFSPTLMTSIQASILLAAASSPPAFCGRAVGSAKLGVAALPVNITYAASPWIPGTPLPDGLPQACGEASPAPDAGVEIDMGSESDSAVDAAPEPDAAQQADAL